MSVGVSLAQLTTIRLGGPAQGMVDATSEEQIVEAVRRADVTGQPLLVLGGGSNVVVADTGFAGTVVRVAARGISALAAGRHIRLQVAAGEPWADLVARAAADGLAGIECLAGIPGTAGATPIQNVGAYGQQVADTIVSVRAYDRAAGEVIEIGRDSCRFDYRSSIFRGSARFVVTGVVFELERAMLSRPVTDAGLVHRLQLVPGARVPLADVNEAVLALRRQKGMVLDRADPESVSVGSFFLNPIMTSERFAELVARSTGADLPAWPLADGRVKTSAAWLIERAGFPRGFGVGRVGISTKHTLALVNRGGATTAELVALARQIRQGVAREFDVELVIEPTLVGVKL